MYARYLDGKIVELASLIQPGRLDWPEADQISVSENHLDVVAFRNRLELKPPNPMLRLVDATIAGLAGDSTALTAIKTDLEA